MSRPLIRAHCDACAAPSKKLTEHEALTNGRKLWLCRACSAIVNRVQANLAASRAFVGIK